MAALLPLACGSVRGFLCVPRLQGSGQNRCTCVPSPSGQRSSTSVSTSPLFRALTLLQTFWCSHSDPEPVRPRVAPHPGWQMEVQRARPRPQAVPIPRPSPSPLPSSPGASVRLEARACHPSGWVPCQALPFWGWRLSWRPAHPLRMSCLSAAH